MTKKDDYAIVLDYLPHGYPLEGRMMPIVQAMGEKFFTLLELAPIRGATFAPHEKVYIGPDKRDKVNHIIGRLSGDKLTEQGKARLQEVIANIVKERENEFVEFFNNAAPISMRLHQLSLLPGFGKKHMQELLNERNQKKFESFEDIRARVSNIPDPRKAIEKRLWEEIMEKQRYTLFVS